MSRALLNQLLGVNDSASTIELLREYTRAIRLAEEEFDEERIIELRWALASRDGIEGASDYMCQLIEGPAIGKDEGFNQPVIHRELIEVCCPNNHPRAIYARQGCFEFLQCELCDIEFVAACQMEVQSIVAERSRGLWHLRLEASDFENHVHQLECAVRGNTALPRVGERVTILAVADSGFALIYKGQIIPAGAADASYVEQQIANPQETKYEGLGRVLISAALGLLAFLVWGFPLLQLSHETGNPPLWSLITILSCCFIFAGGIMSLLTPQRRGRGLLSVLIALATTFAVLDSGQGWPLTVGVAAWVIVAVAAVPVRRLFRRLKVALKRKAVCFN